MERVTKGLFILVLALTATIAKGGRDVPMTEEDYNPQFYGGPELFLHPWLRGKGFPGGGGPGGIFPGFGGPGGGIFPGFGRPGGGIFPGFGGPGGLFPGFGGPGGFLPGKPLEAEGVEARSDASQGDQKMVPDDNKASP